MPSAQKIRWSTAGFATVTLILLVAVTLLVITTGLALADPPAKQAESLDTGRRSDLAVIQHALEEYAANNNGQFPVTARANGQYDAYGNRQPQCFGCGLDEYATNNLTGVPFTRDNWIPELVDQGYLPSLPLDPQTGQAAGGLCQSSGWPRGYIYVSNGQNYKLQAFCTPSTGLIMLPEKQNPYCTGPQNRILKPNPDYYPELKPYVDPRQPSFHYAIYSPAWACI